MDSNKKTMATKIFRGDADNLVDALIEACKKPTPPAGPLVERQLVSAFETGFFEPADAVCSPATPPRWASLSKDGQLKHATGALLGSNVTPSNKRKGSPPNLRREPASCNDKKNVRSSNNKATRPSSPVERSPAAVVTNTMTTTTPSGSPHYKCPGHFHSPKPEHLPMPTFSILARAHMHAAARTTCVAA